MMTKRPMQVYLDDRDHSLLEALTRRLRRSKAEVVREAIRRWAVELTGADDPVLRLIGELDDPDVPVDLSARHDGYAVSTSRPARAAEPRFGAGPTK